MSDEERHTERTSRGIFIPYEKLLENIDHKLDRITEKLEDLAKGKVDLSTFESFKQSYEQRHEALSAKVSALPKPEEFVSLAERTGELETDMVGRRAVKAYVGLVLGGGLLAILAVVLQIIELAKSG